MLFRIYELDSGRGRCALLTVLCNSAGTRRGCCAVDDGYTCSELESTLDSRELEPWASWGEGGA